MTTSLHWRTPDVQVNDPRALPVRQVAYLRTVTGAVAEARITRQHHDARGYLTEQWDPRLFGAAASPNMAKTCNLAGAPLLIESADAGWRLTLPGLAGETLEQWDARGQHWRSTYDEQLRVLSVATDAAPDLETFTYADASADAGHNRRGQMTQIQDHAGILSLLGFTLLGQTRTQSRTFEDALSNRSEHTFGPLNQLLTQTDAGGHCQHLRHDLAGQLKSVQLLLDGSSQAQTIWQDVQYNAAGQLIEQLAGNGMCKRWHYDPANGRLDRAVTTLVGQTSPQHLAYFYDPVGNVVRIEDLTFQPVYFANQLIDGERHFAYDSLYRLIHASGHDALPAPDLPGRPLPSDPDNLRNYTQQYDYDAGGNLIRLVHARDVGGYTRQMFVAPASNRALRWKDGDPVPDFAAFFDAHGNQCKLQHGVDLLWNARDQLQQVTLLKHDNGLPDDRETYRYSQGERVSKRHETHTANTTHFLQVRYLPGLEIRSRDNGQTLHVITLPGNVRCLHWQEKPPAGVENDQLRYNLDDHLGSSLIELDQNARLISRETYYPFGGTALWLPCSSTAVDYKTVRYSGKEMDVSGLYYYGLRYYAPWLQRWVSADPAGEVDGLNQYAMVGNNPMLYVDDTGGIKNVFDVMSGFVGLLKKTGSATDQLNSLAEKFDGLIPPDADINELRKTLTFRTFLSSSYARHSIWLGLKSGASVGASVGGIVGSLSGPAGAGIGTVIGMVAGGLVGAIALPAIRYYFFKKELKIAQVLHTKELQEGVTGLTGITEGITEGIIQGTQDLLSGGSDILKKIQHFTDSLNTYPQRIQDMFYTQLSELASDKQREVMKLLHDGLDPFEAISQVLKIAQEMPDPSSEADGVSGRLAELASAHAESDRSRPTPKPRLHLPRRPMVRETSV